MWLKYWTRQTREEHHMQSANFELTPSWDDPAVLVITGLSPRRIWGYVHKNADWFLLGDDLPAGKMHRAESFEAAQAAALKAAEARLAYEKALAKRGEIVFVDGQFKRVLPESLGAAA
jgi:hypothetical protein